MRYYYVKMFAHNLTSSSQAMSCLLVWTNEVLKVKYCEMLNFEERYEERNCISSQHCGQQQCPDLIT